MMIELNFTSFVIYFLFSECARLTLHVRNVQIWTALNWKRIVYVNNLGLAVGSETLRKYACNILESAITSFYFLFWKRGKFLDCNDSALYSIQLASSCLL